MKFPLVYFSSFFNYVVLFLLFVADDCVPPPCGDTGICHNVPTGYACLCVTGYTGRNCQTGEMLFVKTHKIHCSQPMSFSPPLFIYSTSPLHVYDPCCPEIFPEDGFGPTFGRTRIINCSSEVEGKKRGGE